MVLSLKFALVLKIQAEANQLPNDYLVEIFSWINYYQFFSKKIYLINFKFHLISILFFLNVNQLFFLFDGFLNY